MIVYIYGYKHDIELPNGESIEDLIEKYDEAEDFLDEAYAEWMEV